MENEKLKTLHLFAGAGGGILSDLILGHDPVCAVEWDPYCCQILRERAAEGWFPNLRVFEGDVRLFPASDWKGRVDCIHAGFPCQPHSVAGKRKGADDDRNLWPATAGIIGEICPRWVFLENVPGLVSNGFIGTVLGDLARLGYDARWTVLGADQVGAPHRRDRWFCVANAQGGGNGRDGLRETCEVQSDRASPDVSNTSCEGLAGSEQHGTPDSGGAGAYGSTAELREDVAHAAGGTRRREAQGEAGLLKRSGEDVADAKRFGLERPKLQPNFKRNGDDIVSQFIYEGWWSVEPDFRGMVDGLGFELDKNKRGTECL